MLLSLAFAIAQAQAPIAATPSDEPWQLNMSETTCLASRKYLLATGEEVMIHLNPDLVGNGLVLIVDGPAAGRDVGLHAGGSLILANGVRIERVGMATEKIDDDRYFTRINTSFTPTTGPMPEGRRLGMRASQRYIRMNPEQRERERRKAIESARLDDAPTTVMDGKSLTIVYGDDAHEIQRLPLDTLQTAFADCRRAILEDMGVADIGQDKVAKPPIQFSSGLTVEDMPDEVKRGQSMTLEAMLRVDADGSVGDCRIIVGSGQSAFDQKYCAAIRKSGEYLPALDGNGEAVATYIHEREYLAAGRPRSSAVLTRRPTTSSGKQNPVERHGDK